MLKSSSMKHALKDPETDISQSGCSMKRERIKEDPLLDVDE
jgi:hypothetical protein